MTTLWLGFIALVVFLVTFDLVVLNRHAHVIGTKEALRWTCFWVLLALGFGVFVYYLYANHWLGVGEGIGQPRTPQQAWQQYLTGYIVEATLSLDNVFVIALIFSYFQVPAENQHRALFWGILGAMIFRGVMIGAGAALVHRFEWIMYVFGVVLLLTALRMLVSHDESVEPDKNPLVRLARRLYPVSGSYDGQKFLTRLSDGRRALTPLALVLLVIESTDVLFAVDSIPAIFGITRDPFIVFSSNMFAVLGLRSVYFALAGMMQRFRYIKPSLVFVLLFISVKMLLPPQLKEALPDAVSLAVIFGILLVGVVASLLVPMPGLAPHDETQLDLPGTDGPEGGAG